jgi:hypothetical protein
MDLQSRNRRRFNLGSQDLSVKICPGCTMCSTLMTLLLSVDNPSFQRVEMITPLVCRGLASVTF